MAMSAQEELRPNIVFILVDDLGWGDVSYLGSEIKTPSIDQLAANGVRLERGYAYPICSPTRAALMSGKNPVQYGVVGPMAHDAMLSDELTLLPEYFAEGGYKTWMVGKWHLGGFKRSAMPHRRGFDHFYGFLGGFIDFYQHIYFGGVDWQRNGETLREEGYATNLLTDEALGLIESHDGQAPFFLYLSYNSPHTPLQYPPIVEDNYDLISSPDRQVFAQMTTDVDAAIGKIVSAIQRKDLLGNTVIVFMSDNGGHLLAGASNGPLRGGKGQVYEGGVRVPALMSWPASLDRDVSFSEPVYAQDWLPTLLDLSNIDYDPSRFDGRSVWPTLERGESLADREPVVVATKSATAVYDWPWKLVQHHGSGNNPPSNELYNVLDDPYEREDLAGEQDERVAMLKRTIDSLPDVELIFPKGPPPEALFKDDSGRFDYNLRMPETREPWAESARPE